MVLCFTDEREVCRYKTATLRFVIGEKSWQTDIKIFLINIQTTYPQETKNIQQINTAKTTKTHIRYCLWTVTAVDTPRRYWQTRRAWRKNSVVQAPDNIILIMLSGEPSFFCDIWNLPCGHVRLEGLPRSSTLGFSRCRTWQRWRSLSTFSVLTRRKQNGLSISLLKASKVRCCFFFSVPLLHCYHKYVL